MIDSAERIRRAVDELGPRGPQRRIPRALRLRVQRYARRRLAGGATGAAIAAEVDISWTSIRRWLQTTEPEAAGAGSLQLEPVELVESKLDGREPSAIVVRAPGALVIEGLGIAEVAELVRRLG